MSSIAPHYHNCYELVYYQSGSGHTRIGKATYAYTAGTYSIIHPGTLHDERRELETDVMFVGFTMHGVHSPALQEGLFSDYSNRRIEHHLQEMNAEMQAKYAYYAKKLDLLISQILIEHLRKQNICEPKQLDEGLSYVCNYLNEHYNQPIRLEELAEMAGYSYHHFRHMFRDQFGIPPLAYVIGKRLEQARRLLRHTSLSITDIALECGFSNDSQFSTIFKREVNLTPREYRKSLLHSI